MVMLHIHICRKEASFQRREDVWPSESTRKDEKRGFMLVPTTVRSLSEGDIVDRTQVIRMGNPLRFANLIDKKRLIGPIVKSMFKSNADTIS